MKIKFLVLSLLVGVATLAYGFTAHADNDKSKNEIKLGKLITSLKNFDFNDDDLADIERVSNAGPSLLIGQRGKTVILGATVVSVSAGNPRTMVVEIWKQRINVDMSGARMIPDGSSLESVVAGHVVNVRGEMNASSGVVKAKVINDLQLKGEASVTAIKSMIRELVIKLREVQQSLGLPLTPLPEN